MEVSFQLTMPNVGSWNGKWTGAEKKYYLVKSVVNKDQKSFIEKLIAEKETSWYYNFGDGWGASVSMEVITKAEALKRRKISAGFCGYEWMVDEILKYGKILTKKERDEYKKAHA